MSSYATVELFGVPGWGRHHPWKSFRIYKLSPENEYICLVWGWRSFSGSVREKNDRTGRDNYVVLVGLDQG